MTLLKILDVTYHQNFASLGTSASHVANIVFSLYRFDRVTRVNLSLSDPFFLLSICPCKTLLLFLLKNLNLHASCLNFRQQQ